MQEQAGECDECDEDSSAKHTGLLLLYRPTFFIYGMRAVLCGMWYENRSIRKNRFLIESVRLLSDRISPNKRMSPKTISSQLFV